MISAPKAIVCTPAGQRHEIGAILAAWAISAAGWQVIYLGADLPARDIARAAEQTGASLVALSIIHPSDDPKLITELSTLRDRLPDGVKIVVGGDAAGSYAKILRKIGAEVAQISGVFPEICASTAGECSGAIPTRRRAPNRSIRCRLVVPVLGFQSKENGVTMSRNIQIAGLLILLLSGLGVSKGLAESDRHGRDWSSYEWTLVSEDTGWEARAGLQVVDLRNNLYLMGGRTPRPPSYPPIIGDSEIWGDVWKSTDLGESWQKILETDDANHWPARAYFEAVTKGDFIYVIGGQNFKVIANPGCPPPYIDCLPFLPASDFFNDVWRSRDGVSWRRMTADAGWEPRAGLSAVVFRGDIYVLGGSQRDDDAVGGDERIYFNDVWKSRDGRNWVLLTASAPWAPRAGARVVVKNGYIYLLGGEAGFFCAPPPCEPPYFNDVWRSRNGVDWELVTEHAPWPARPGHQAVVQKNRIVLFGGFGLSNDPSDPFGSGNPMDVWISANGADWELVSESPWNADSPEQIKYDFDALVLEGRGAGRGPAIYTFGGDRETFDFTDPLNYLNVDNDVWRFGVSEHRSDSFAQDRNVLQIPNSVVGMALGASPNPFTLSTTISFNLASAQSVDLSIYDVSGRHLRTIVEGEIPVGNHLAVWDGRDKQGNPMTSGIYFYRLIAGDQAETRRLILTRSSSGLDR